MDQQQASGCQIIQQLFKNVTTNDMLNGSFSNASQYRQNTNHEQDPLSVDVQNGVKL
jgi:hypothetical protein